MAPIPTERKGKDDAFFAGTGRPKFSGKGPAGPPSGRPRPGQTKGGKPDSKQHKAQPDKGKAKAKPVDDSLILAGQLLTAPPPLGAYSCLRRLDVSKTGLASLGFVKEVKNTLTWLNVSGNQLDNVDAWEGVHELSGLFGKSENLAPAFATPADSRHPLFAQS